MRGVVLAGLFTSLICGQAFSMPIVVAGHTDVEGGIEAIANGCGPGMYRTLAGDCRRNREVFVGPRRGYAAPPPCPRGYLRDPDPAQPLCYPVY